MKKLRWGVLGAANIARKQVIPAIQASQTGQVVAIASRDRARAEALAREQTIPQVYDSYEALLASDQVDAVYIPLPNSEHRRWTLAAAEAGKHILCEKPLAVTAAEAEEMVIAAQRAGVVLAEAFMYRHHPLTRKVLELLRSGAIGELRLIRSSFTFVLDRQQDIRRVRELGGGALLDVGCYCVNLARLVTGQEPVAVAGYADYGPSDVDESFAGVLRFGDGVLATFECSFRAAGGSNYELIGTHGKLWVRQGFKPERHEEGEIQIHQQGEISRIFTEAVDQYTLMVDDFAKAVWGRRPHPYPPSDAIANLRVLDRLAATARQAR
ncbi:Gfo/Idh/MocA family protein [Kallotenue papyrolyticum]|uniref:Gfo/Idh/MocA family protein n=1 Tax=Kallotenue papyrolyticum TaxID=1325125 RepID=UPI000492692B|nr:Gfo/Idh/MocA family oxidoreductase [Kallotenue papyrolyticum]